MAMRDYMISKSRQNHLVIRAKEIGAGEMIVEGLGSLTPALCVGAMMGKSPACPRC